MGLFTLALVSQLPNTSREDTRLMNPCVKPPQIQLASDTIRRTSGNNKIKEKESTFRQIQTVVLSGSES